MVMPDFPFTWWRIVNARLPFHMVEDSKLFDGDNLGVMRDKRLTPLLDLVENKIISRYKRKSYQLYA